MKAPLFLLVLPVLAPLGFAQSSSLDKKPRSAASLPSDSLSPFGRKFTPAPAPVAPPKATAADGQRAAIQKHPELGVAGSALNVAFVSESRARRESDPGFFTEADWPVRLADEIAAQLAAEAKATALGLPPGNRKLAVDFVSLHGSVASWPRRKSTWPPSDRELGETLSRAATVFLDAAKAGDTARATQELARFQTLLHQTLQNKKVIGLKFNEFMDRELEEEVRFGLYRDADRFYVELGTGSFRVLGDLSVEQLLDLLEAGLKARAWVSQCEEEKLETSKAIGKWGGVEMEFQATEGGAHSWVWLDVRGKVDTDRLLSHVRVRLSPLNFQCLLQRMVNARDLIEQRQREAANAAKLK